MKLLWPSFEYQAHQIEGVNWMLEKETVAPYGGILCDEMGLGKTIQLLGLMNEHKVGATLLVGPLCVLEQWQLTAERCGFQVWRAHTTNPTWVMPAGFRPSATQLYLINYERALARPLLTSRRVWDRVIFDEAHRLVKHNTKIYKSMLEIEATHKWFLTATPIVNSLTDARNLFALLGVEIPQTSLEAMRPYISDLVLCRRMDDLRSEIQSLPNAALGYKHILDFATREEADCYRGIQGAIVKRWKSLDADANTMTEKFRMIMRLRQISINPQVYIAARKRQFPNYYREDWLEPSTKFIHLRNMIEKAAEEKQHRWLVFCHFHDEMELLQDYLLQSPIVRDVNLYNGAMSASEKSDAIAKSKEPLVKNLQEVLLVQLQSGGVGLNLQHCDRVVFMGPWWTAALMDQAIGRAVRIGQKEQVEVHHLILKEEATLNIDRMMSEKAAGKRDLCTRFLDIACGIDKSSSSNDAKDIEILVDADYTDEDEEEEEDKDEEEEEKDKDEDTKQQQIKDLADAPFMKNRRNFTMDEIRLMANDYPALHALVNAVDNKNKNGKM